MLNILEITPVKVIPASRDREPGAAAPKRELTLTRRSILKGTGVFVGMLVISSPLALLAPFTVWAVELKALSEAEDNTLLQMGRVLLPHAKLPDAAYALLVKDLDTEAVQGAQAAAQLHEGIAALDELADGSFIKASAKRRLAAVKAMESKLLFNTIRGQYVTSLYGSEVAFATFGYPGSTWEKRGYITRGFQDLKRLPAPPVEVSPPPFLG